MYQLYICIIDTVYINIIIMIYLFIDYKYNQVYDYMHVIPVPLTVKQSFVHS